jgi:predicted Zn-dependent protease with MMP-like domain
LPEELQGRLDNVEVVVEDWPPVELMRSLGLPRGQLLLGFYRGVPLTKRGARYQLVLPDRITIYQRAIEATSRSREELVRRVREVVRHEIAHYFGFSDEQLEEIMRREEE